MEITLLEDPACCWCWAFQPVVTALEYEILAASLKRAVKLRRVLGGLSDRPFAEGSLIARIWTRAAEISSMPFDAEIWDDHLLETTFEACRAVKAATVQGPAAASRLLRRLRESFFTERVPIDKREAILDMAREEGLDVEMLAENLASGRASFLFDRDRHEAAPYRFGFPTLLIRKHPNDPPVVLHGLVAFSEILQVLGKMGLTPADRKRFADRPEDWDRLFSIHRRLAPAEIRAVTGLDGEDLLAACARNGVRKDGAFWTRGDSPAPRAQSGATETKAGEVTARAG